MSPHLGNRGQVFDKTHSQCVALMRQCGDRLQVTEYSTVQYSTVQYTVQCVQVTVERGDHIVPSFQEMAGRAELQQGDTARRRWVEEDDISAQR